MNHLAHALIAERTGTSLAGNLMGDFVRGPIDDRFPPDVAEGIRLHRGVDAWTDAHPLFRRSRERVRPAWRRWSGILVDLGWDHVLARHWRELGLAGEPLPAFAARVYGELDRAREAGLLPARMHRFHRYLVSTDLLVAYAEPTGIRRALSGLSARVGRENPLAAAADDLPELAAGWEADFRAFRMELFAWLDAGGGRA